MNARASLAPLSLLALVACSAPPSRAAAPPSRTSAVAPRATATPEASAAPAEAPPSPPPPRFEVLLRQADLHPDGTDAMYFDTLRLDEGLLVVASMPAKAFLVVGGEVRPLDGFFDGLRSPAPDWDPQDFMVSRLEGTLAKLSFDIFAPSTEHQVRVEGSPGRFRPVRGRGTKATVASWVGVETISEPVTSPKGSTFYERAVEPYADASRGFRFQRLGPSKGEPLPKPAPGTNGCRFAMLGHPFLHYRPDGTLVGIGTLCKSGGDALANAKLDGAAPPFQTSLPRFTEGHVAAEVWRDGTSTVHPLPGAERVADFASFQLLEVPGQGLFVLTQVRRDHGGAAYVARFDGDRWTEVTPSDPPDHLLAHVTPTDELLLFHQSGGHRRRGSTWQRIAFEPRGDCGKELVFDATTAPSGDTFVSGGVTCFWRLAPGGALASFVELPDGAFAGPMIPHRGELYMIARGFPGESLLRLRR